MLPPNRGQGLKVRTINLLNPQKKAQKIIISKITLYILNLNSLLVINKFLDIQKDKINPKEILIIKTLKDSIIIEEITINFKIIDLKDQIKIIITYIKQNKI